MSDDVRPPLDREAGRRLLRKYADLAARYSDLNSDVMSWHVEAARKAASKWFFRNAEALLSPAPSPEEERLREEVERLKAENRDLRLGESQMRLDLEARIMRQLKFFGAIPEGLNPDAHPIDQVVGCCVSNLTARLRAASAPSPSGSGGEERSE